MDFFYRTAFWIAPEDGVLKNHEVGRAMLFRRNFQGRGKLVIAVSADTEYRLFSNGIEVVQGPAASDDLMTFYDVVELTDYLKDGDNELVAEVIGFAGAFPDFYRGGAPMGRMTLRDCFILDGTLKRKDGSSEFIGTDSNWQAADCHYIDLMRCPSVPCAGPGEQHNGGHFKDAVFSTAQVIELGFREETVKNANLYYRLRERMIPFLSRKIESFKSFFDVHGIADSALQAMLDGKALWIPPDSKIEFTLDIEHETTARLLLEFRKGKADVKLFYAESFSFGDQHHFEKDRPHDKIAGPMTDQVSSQGGEWVWKSFFYRAFRFVRVLITTYCETCELRLADVEWEAYPYNNQGYFQSSDKELDRLYEMGMRTLELCSHHVFEDCPYYERVQYPADSLIAARIAMINAGDTKLAEQAIIHFRHSIRENGLTAGSYPSRSPVYLPIWSLYYIVLVDEVYQYSGKKELLTDNLWAIRRILDFFLRYRCLEGGIGRLPYWNIADFSKEWVWLGEPPEIDSKPSAYATFFVAECLKRYQKMSEITGASSDATWAGGIYDELLQESRVFYDEKKKLYADNPAGESFSLLTNAAAVLAEITDDAELIKRSLADKTMKKTAYFGKNLVFDAAIKCGDLTSAEAIISEQKKLLVPGRTVMPEGTPNPRSECHVWAALPNYGLYQLYAGFRPLNAGATRIRISPYQHDQIRVKGALTLMKGLVEFDFSQCDCRIKIPAGITVVLDDGKEITGSDVWVTL